MSMKDEEKIARALKRNEKPEITKDPRGSKTKKIILDPGDNTKFTQHSLDIMMLPKIDTHDAEQVYQRSIEYLKICAKNDMKPNTPGYALALGMDRVSLFRIRNGAIKRPKEVIEVIEKYMALLNAQMEDMLQSGNINPVSGIFLSKNNFGYKDQTEMVVAPSVQEETSAERLIEEAVLMECVDVTKESKKDDNSN